MLFKFKNIGLIKESSIEVKNLTILTGLNDCGKSYITRTIFGIIKTLNETNNREKKNKIKSISHEVDRIYSLCRQNIPLKLLENINHNTIKREISRYIYYNSSPQDTIEIITDFKKKALDILAQQGIKKQTEKVTFKAQINTLLNVLKKVLKAHVQEEPYIGSPIENHINAIQNFFDKKINPEFLEDMILNLSKNVQQYLSGNLSYAQIDKHISAFKKCVLSEIYESLSVSHISIKIPDILKSIENHFQNINNIIFKDSNNNFSEYFSAEIIQKYFNFQLSNLDADAGTLSVVEGANTLLTVDVGSNATLNFNLSSDIFFTDATLIETPIILQLAQHIVSTTSDDFSKDVNSEFNSQIPYHFRDLANKLFKSTGFPSVEFPDIYKELSKIINGEVLYDKEEAKIIYTKFNSKHKIQIINVASGIKAFGVLQLLLSGGFINDNSILIIDEPEVHLHPQWQVEYAKLIVDLSATGIKIIVSSHSPYFIKALNTFSSSKKEKLETKFYYGHKTDDGTMTKFDDVTANLNPIYKTLAKAMIKASSIN